ncbi:MAG: hypothetical protein ABI845_12385 [Polaromonas sp.]
MNGFNPRPSLLTGERRDTRVHRRHRGFNPRPSLLTGEPFRAKSLFENKKIQQLREPVHSDINYLKSEKKVFHKNHSNQ